MYFQIPDLEGRIRHINKYDILHVGSALRTKQPYWKHTTACVGLVYPGPWHGSSWITIPCNSQIEFASYICENTVNDKRMDNRTSIESIKSCPRFWFIDGSKCILTVFKICDYMFFNFSIHLCSMFDALVLQVHSKYATMYNSEFNSIMQTTSVDISIHLKLICRNTSIYLPLINTVYWNIFREHAVFPVYISNNGSLHHAYLSTVDSLPEKGFIYIDTCDAKRYIPVLYFSEQ